MYYLLGIGESYGPTAQHSQDCLIFFIQLNHVYKIKINKTRWCHLIISSLPQGGTLPIFQFQPYCEGHLFGYSYAIWLKLPPCGKGNLIKVAAPYFCFVLCTIVQLYKKDWGILHMLGCWAIALPSTKQIVLLFHSNINYPIIIL